MNASAMPHGWITRLLLGLVIGLITLFIALPMIVIVITSFGSSAYLAFPPSTYSLRWYQTIAEDSAWTAATWNSVRIGILSGALATLLGTVAALALVRGRLPGTARIAALIIAPMMLPHIVVAIGLYPTMLDLGLSRSLWSIVIAHAVVSLPIVFITVSAALKSYGPTLELAAMTLGAGWWRTFFYVTLPMTRSGILVGFVLAFTTSFDELILALFLTDLDSRTLPRMIWEHLAYEVSPTIAAAATAILAASIVLLVIVGLIDRKGVGTTR